MAILFDLDGVLADSGPLSESTWHAFAVRHGIEPATVLDGIHGRPSRQTVERFLAPDEVEPALLRVDQDELDGSDALQPIPGALDVVAHARAAGPWGIVTSGDRRLATRRLAAIGVPLPDVLITWDDITHGKPHPEPYETGLQRLGMPTAVAIEDAPAGIASAKAAGLTVIAVQTTNPPEALQEADVVRATMADVLTYLTTGR